MYSFETEPLFRGTTYIDVLQMVDSETGAPCSLDPADILVWRLSPLGRHGGFALGYGCGLGWDYGFQFGPAASAILNGASIVVLTVGAGLYLSPIGAVQWILNEGQTLALRHPEYRMTLDLTRYGQTARILDTTLQAMD